MRYLVLPRVSSSCPMVLCVGFPNELSPGAAGMSIPAAFQEPRAASNQLSLAAVCAAVTKSSTAATSGAVTDNRERMRHLSPSSPTVGLRPRVTPITLPTCVGVRGTWNRAHSIADKHPAVPCAECHGHQQRRRRGDAVE